jgi:hypothetical protein
MIHIVEKFPFAMSKNPKTSKHFNENIETRNVKIIFLKLCFSFTIYHFITNYPINPYEQVRNNVTNDNKYFFSQRFLNNKY